MVDLADRLLSEIDRVVERVAAPPIDVVGNVLRAIKPLDATDIRGRSAASGRILIVDDNASNRDLLSRTCARGISSDGRGGRDGGIRTDGR